VLGTIRDQAKALRLGLISRFVSLAEVVTWADSLIGQDRGQEAPQLFDLALLRADDVGQAVSLLAEVPGEWSPAAVGRNIARSVHRGLARGQLNEREAASALYGAVLEGLCPDPEFESMVYYFDDGVDLALQGIYGNLAELRAEMLEYLSRKCDAGLAAD
jgi:hypothetical protein